MRLIPGFTGFHFPPLPRRGLRITLEQLQEYMRKQSEEDKKNRSITVEAESVQEALKKASIEMGIPVRGLEYESAS